MENEKNTLLIVDDSMLNHEFLNMIFGDTYNLLKATDGTQALEIMRQNADIIDVVLLDIVMPGMDGYEVLRIMSADDKLKFLPVIVVTAESDVKSELKAFQLGAVDFVVRPFNSRLVLQRVNSVLHKRQLENMRTEYELLKKEAENEKLFSMLVNSAPGGVTLVERDSGGRFSIMYCSKGFSDMLGYPDYMTCLADLMDDPFQMMDEGMGEVFRAQLDDAIEQNRPLDVTLCLKKQDGGNVWVAVNGQIARGEDGTVQLYCFNTDITKEKQQESGLKASAYQEPLTNMYNRSAFYATASKQLAEDPDTDYSIVRLNIGGFKLINDIMGRDRGDQILITIASVIRKHMPEKAICARSYADNFTVLMPTHDYDAEALIQEIRDEVKAAGIVKHDIQLYVGIYKIEDKEQPIEKMCDRASIACRSINGSYSTHVAYYDESMRQAMVEEQEIRDETRRAIDNGEFIVFYQPVYGIKAKRFVSAEALVRWNHPTKGMISPGKFIPIFERNGFIAELDLYVMEEVCKYHKKRRENGLESFPISVNVSRMSLYNPQLFDLITGLAEKYGVEPRYFRIEITETAYNDNPAQLLETVNKLREKSFPVLMDDFGSGYSSLNTLKDIPIDLLKLDMKFMQGFESNERVKTIVTSIARMSRWLNVPMLAEGVETKEQYLFLKSIGCAYIQGYYFSKPAPEREFTETINENICKPADYTLQPANTGEDINSIMGGDAFLADLLRDFFDGYGIYEMNGDRLDLIRADEGYTRITGIDPDDFKGRDYDMWSKVHPDDVDKSKKACRDAINSSHAIRATIRIRNTMGELLYLDEVHKRLGGSDENPIFCIAFNDVTDQMKTNVTLSTYYGAEVGGSELGTRYPHTTVIEYDHRTDTVIASPSFSMFSASKFTIDEFKNEELYKRGISVHSDDRAEFTEFLKRVKEQELASEITLRMEMADGSYKWCRLCLLCDRNEDGSIVRTICTINIVHEEIEAKQKLEQTTELLDRAIRNIPVGVGILRVIDGKPTPIFTSDQIYHIFAADRNTDQTDATLAIDFPDDVLKPGSYGDTTRFTYKEDGTPFWLNTKYKVTEENGELMVYAAIGDVSEQMESSRRQEVQEQIYHMLLEESKTVVFDYNTETDVFSYYPWRTTVNAQSHGPIVINDFTKNVKEFRLIDEEYRETVLDIIRRLSKSVGTEELAMKLLVDGKDLWYRCLFKSVSDDGGKVFRIIGKLEDVDEEITQINLVREKAMYDALCVDIYNKATTEELIRSALDHNNTGCLIMIDVDDFKSINDQLGHLFGDEYLKTFASKLKSAFRGTDIVGRCGGDEFMIFMDHSDSTLAKKKAEAVMELVSAIEVPQVGKVNCSIGIAVAEEENSDFIHLMKQADSALYQAKNNGKNCIVLFEEKTMDEGNYRLNTGKSDRPVLSSNPHASASLIMRVFSALYTSMDVTAGINRMLELVGSTFEVSRAYIVENSDDDLYCSCTFEWCSEGAPSAKDKLQNMSYEKDFGGTYQDTLNEEGIFYCHDIANLPEAQRELAERHGIKSMLQCAITEDGKLKGFVGFDECSGSRFWTQEQVDALAFIAKVLSTFLMKERSKKLSESYSKSVEAILDSHPAFAYVVDPETHKLLYMNSVAKKAVGDEKVGSLCYDAICGDSNCAECPVKDYRENGEGRYVKMIVPSLNRVVKARTDKIEWKGKQAHLIICVDMNEGDTSKSLIGF